MQMTFRWYGEGNDRIKLSDIKQIPGVSLTRTYVVLDNVKQNIPVIPRTQAAQPLK